MDSKRNLVLSKMTLFDDRLFRLFSKDQEFICEILREVLKSNEFEVMEFLPQYEVYDLLHKSIRVDVLLKFTDGTLVNVEIQKCNSDDHIKRCRYYSSLLTLNSLGKRTNYNELGSLILIFITEKDFLGYGKVIYHTKRMILENNEILEDGLTEIFVNAEVEDDTRLSRLMKMMKEPKYLSEEFARFTELKSDFYFEKTEKGGKNNMIFTEEEKDQVYNEYQMEWLQQGRAEGMQQGAVTTLVDLVKDNIITINVAASKANMTVEEFRNLL